MNFHRIKALLSTVPCYSVIMGMSLCSCCCPQNFLSVQTDYLNMEDLASYQVKTPDPCLNYPRVGQRLFVNWSIPKCYLLYDNLHLEVRIRFRNHQEITMLVPICKKRGTYCYKLWNKEYVEKRGILTYKVELYGDDLLLEEQQHQLWVDLITFDVQGGKPPQLDPPQGERQEQDQAQARPVQKNDSVSKENLEDFGEDF